MKVIFILIFISMVVAGGFLALFIWASNSGQFEDTMTPSMRMLFDNKKKAEDQPQSEQKAKENTPLNN